MLVFVVVVDVVMYVVGILRVGAFAMEKGTCGEGKELGYAPSLEDRLLACGRGSAATAVRRAVADAVTMDEG